MWRFALSALALGACFGPGEHRCADSAACGDNGVCVVETGYCAFASPTCCGGLAYGTGAGPLADTCVTATECADVDASIDDDASSPIDAAVIDAPAVDAPPALVVAHLSSSDAYLGTGAYLVGGDAVIDTDAMPAMLPAGVSVTIAASLPTGAPVMVLHADAVAVAAGGELRVVGSRPLIIVAREITVSGVINASADLDTPGAGGGRPGGGAGRGGDGGSDTNNDGGGGGAGFGTPGGRGGDDISTPLSRGGDAGAPYGTADLIELVGGSGGGGGSASCGSPGPAAGAGGGALQLSATDSIAIETGGVIDVGGGGGRAGRLCATAEAGRGGGSGGGLYLQAPVVTIAGAATANGGGGGSSSSISSGPGADGADATRTTSSAAGGRLGATPCGGDGGASIPAQPGRSVSTHDGCGGGGAVGRIVVRGRLVNDGLTSPAPVNLPL